MKSFLKNNSEKIGVYSLVGIVLITFYFLISKIGEITEALGFLGSVLSPFVIGIALAYILWPFVNKFEGAAGFVGEKISSLSIFQKLKIKSAKKEENSEKKNRLLRAISILAMYFLLFILIVLLINRIIPQILDSVMTLVNNIPYYIEQIDSFVVSVFSKYSPENMKVDHTVVYDFLTRYITSATEWLLNWLVNVPKELTNGVSNSIIGIILSIYFIYDKETFKNVSIKVTTAIFGKFSNRIFKFGSLAGNCFSEFFMGKIIDSLIIGLLAFPFMLIIHKPYALLISAIIGITNIIPYFGPIIGAIPGALIILISEPEKTLWYLIFVLVLQQFDGNILGPRILGNRTGLSPVGVIFGIVVGGKIWGFAGMLLGVPATAVLYAVAREIINRRYENKIKSEKNDEDGLQKQT